MLLDNPRDGKPFVCVAITLGNAKTAALDEFIELLQMDNKIPPNVFTTNMKGEIIEKDKPE